MSSSDSTIPHTRVAIVGTGFAGIGVAARLLADGMEDLVVFERSDEVGGVWRDNVYPGAACDVHSHLYEFSFAPNPGWSRRFSPQPEIRAYLHDLAERFGVAERIRFRHEVTAARWDDEAACWRIETSEGAWTADVLVAAPGLALAGGAPTRIDGQMFDPTLQAVLALNPRPERARLTQADPVAGRVARISWRNRR